MDSKIVMLIIPGGGGAGRLEKQVLKDLFTLLCGVYYVKRC